MGLAELNGVGLLVLGLTVMGNHEIRSIKRTVRVSADFDGETEVLPWFQIAE